MQYRYNRYVIILRNALRIIMHCYICLVKDRYKCRLGPWHFLRANTDGANAGKTGEREWQNRRISFILAPRHIRILQGPERYRRQKVSVSWPVLEGGGRGRQQCMLPLVACSRGENRNENWRPHFFQYYGNDIYYKISTWKILNLPLLLIFVDVALLIV